MEITGTKQRLHTFKIAAECFFCGRAYLANVQRLPLPPDGQESAKTDHWVALVRLSQVQRVDHVCPACWNAIEEEI